MQKLEQDGKALTTVKLSRSAEPIKVSLLGLGFDRVGNLVICRKGRIQIFDSQGAHLTDIVTLPEPPLQFDSSFAPEAKVTDSFGNTHTISGGVGRWAYYHAMADETHALGLRDGDNLMAALAAEANGQGTLHFPRCVAVDNDGRVWVADASERVHVFTF